MRRLALVSGLALGLSACTSTMAWRRADWPIRSDAGFSVSLPPGWMVLASGGARIEGDFAASRDGPGLQCIAGGVSEPGPADSPELVAFGAWRQMPLHTRDVLPQHDPTEDERRAWQVFSRMRDGEAGPPRLAVTSTEDLGGFPGFRAEIEWSEPGGLPARAVVRGTTIGKKLYWILYAAPSRHYFDLDIATFENVARTFRIGSQSREANAPR